MMSEYEFHARAGFVCAWYRKADLRFGRAGLDNIIAVCEDWEAKNPGLAAVRRVEFRQQREISGRAQNYR